MQYESINSADQLQQFCDRIAECPQIAFDTEFVSEDSYRPILCLIQVAAGDRLAIIDPMPMEQTEAFWQLLTQPGRTVIAHAAREEARFCYRFTGKPIAGLFDTQLAAGFVGMEYPASLGTLVQRLVNKTLPKGETRTNWGRRPLTRDQIIYALHDVTNLQEMH
ncbi:MAG: ribonuclease D [Pirellulales bacterium]|nr:ribonuclease D [Pirellulales bacterium]